MNLSINNNRGFAVWTLIGILHISSIANLFRFVKPIHSTPLKIRFIKPIGYTGMISTHQPKIFTIIIAQEPAQMIMCRYLTKVGKPPKRKVLRLVMLRELVQEPIAIFHFYTASHSPRTSSPSS
jgi:hypothetical protein